MRVPRRLIFAMFAAGCCLGGICAGQTTAPAARPNIVFIDADDLGYGDLACHGHPTILTPHIDRLAREGTDFQSFLVVNPVCSPSRVSIVTGRFPSRFGVHQHFATHAQNVARGMPDWLDPRAPLLPRLLREAGYRTAHYGKWHLSGGGIAGAPLPEAYGYDDAAVWTGPGRHALDETPYRQPAGVDGAHDPQAACWLSVAATDHAVRFIRQSAGRPFYVNLWLHETHHLVAATEEDRRPYPDVSEPERTYFAAVTRADRQVGRILEVLDELGLSDNTIVVFTSDNGPENMHAAPGQKFYFSRGNTGGLRGRKRSLLLGGVNVPFIVRWPAMVPAGRVDRETPLAGVDMFPTLLAAAGVTAPADAAPDGENMLEAFAGTPRGRSRPVFWWWRGGHGGDDWPAFAMRDGAWMLVMDESRSRVELYDVVADRVQTHDRAALEPGRVAEMRVAIDAWLATLPTQVDPAMQSPATKAGTPRAKANDDGLPSRAESIGRPAR